MTRAVCALALILSSTTTARASDYRVSPEGRTFRTRFDPASRAWLGASGSMSGTSSASVATSEIVGGIAFRTRDTDGAAAKVVWQVDHRALSGLVAPFASSTGKLPALDVTLYSVSMHRHDPSPRLVLPTSPPIGVRFPFDTGVELAFARAWAPRRVTGDGFARLGVARATAFVDPWRSRSAGRSLELGIGVRYDIDVHGAMFAHPRVVHRIAPMTAASIRFRYQTLDGLSSIDARAEAVPHWASDGGWALGVSASAYAERTLLAVNDVPLSVFAHADVTRVPSTDSAASVAYARIGAGLSFAYSLR